MMTQRCGPAVVLASGCARPAKPKHDRQILTRAAELVAGAGPTCRADRLSFCAGLPNGWPEERIPWPRLVSGELRLTMTRFARWPEPIPRWPRCGNCATHWAKCGCSLTWPWAATAATAVCCPLSGPSRAATNRATRCASSSGRHAGCGPHSTGAREICLRCRIFQCQLLLS